MYERPYAFTKVLRGTDHPTALARVREVLGAEGFGVLTEIDVKATLHKKLGVERKPYVILGACNAPLAHRALEAEPAIGVFLPCNVDVFEGEAGETVVQAVNPEALFRLAEAPGLAPIAADAAARLRRVLDRL
jgi:uncharacterized protein (DUF302 family)